MSAAKAPEAIEAPSDLPEAHRLDVAVVEFDPGLPANEEPIPEGIYPEIREAEAKLLAIQLKNTLAKTGQWGTVSVLPEQPSASDVIVTSTILRSDGLSLHLLVEVHDASGRTWFKHQYHTKAEEGSYGATDRELDPHQPMFNTIANAMVKARSKLETKELEDISTISGLQFASRLSAPVFGGYLETDESGMVTIVRLPARDEPMLERVEEVRLRDEMFVDTMGIHYQNFAANLEPNYWHWREASSQELIAKEDLRREQILRTTASALTLAAIVLTGALGSANAAIAAAVAGSTIIEYQMQTVYALGQERQMHEEGLHELAQSFAVDVQPMVVEIDETNVRLTGTAAAQYEEWQRLLQDVYNAETSVINDIYMLPRQPTQETWTGDNRLPMVPSPQDVEYQ